MPALALVAAVALGAPMTDDHNSQQPAVSRFVMRQPLAGAQPVLMDTRGYGANFANIVANERKLQARIMWIDATANVDRYNTEEKIVELVDKIARAGFNTVALDVKPISGHVIYPSKIAPKLTEWKGKLLPLDFDPVAIFERECKKTGVSLLLSLNAFSEGHSIMKSGLAYEKTEWQTVLYEPRIVADFGGQRFPVNAKPNALDPSGASIAWVDEGRVLSLLEPGQTAVAVDWPRGGVVEVVSGPANVPAVPKRGYVLIGSGSAAAFLAANAKLAMKSILDTEPDYVRISERPEQQVPLMVNPNSEAVQSYALSVIEEVVRNYDADGYLYDDRFRYAGINADFSPRTQGLFEHHIGKRINWPDDVFKFSITPDFGRALKPGPYYNAWMAWRATQLRTYLERVRFVVEKARKGAQVGLYAGSWYGEYPGYGVNVGSPKLDAGFWFLSPEYKATGLASLADFLITGCYYPTATMWDGIANGAGIGNTVEGGGQLSMRIARDECWTYAGIMLSQFKDDPDRLMSAMQAACGSTQGVMVFDLSHDSDAMWPTFTRAFSEPRRAPHSDPKSLAVVRKKRAAFDKKGGKEEPITIGLGSAGTGL